jgi:hypothetical protein
VCDLLWFCETTDHERKSLRFLTLVAAVALAALALAAPAAQAAPPNDDLAAATDLGNVFAASGGGSNELATKEPGEPDHAGNAGGHSVWFSWTAPKDMGVTVTTCADQLDMLLAVYTGGAYPLTEVASNDDEQAYCDQRSSVAFAASAGTTYRIAVDGKDGETGEFSLRLDRTPLNDDLADAESFGSSLPWWHEGNRLATKEPGEPGHAGNTGGHSVWFKWTAPNSGKFSFSTNQFGDGVCSGNPLDTLLAVYTGDAYPLTEVVSNDDGGACEDGSSRVAFEAVEGDSYEIAIDGKNGAVGNLELVVRGEPANDDLAAAESLFGGAEASISGNNEFGTKEPGEPDHAGGAGGRSLWYSWVAPAGGAVVVDTCGSELDTLLAVYTGDAYPLAEVASDDDGATCGGGASQATFEAVQGTTYKIAVDGKNDAEGQFSLHLRGRPSNDDLIGAKPYSLPLVGDTTMELGSNLMATQEPGEPEHAGLGGGRSVWFKWTAPTSGTYSLSTGEYGNGGCYNHFDSLLAVYTGNSYPLTEVASDDDGGPCGGGASRVVFDGLAGATYLIAVDGKGGVEGSFALALQRRPAYDQLANATDLSLAAPAPNDLATKEPGEPDHAGDPGGHSLWYSWTPSQAGQFEIDTCNSNFDTLLAAYTGSAFPLTPIGGDDDGCGQQSKILMAARTNVAYKIAVDGKGGATGLVDLSLRRSALELDTQIDSGPTGPTSDPTPTFGFHSNFLGTGFRCQFDGEPYADCSAAGAQPSAPLSAGPHVFRVKAVNQDSAEDPSPATRAFIVTGPSRDPHDRPGHDPDAAPDVQPPDTAIATKPRARMVIRKKVGVARFGFVATEPGSTFICQLDRKAPVPCPSPKSYSVKVGDHLFSVSAVDAAGNRDPSPAQYAFEVKRRGAGH